MSQCVRWAAKDDAGELVALNYEFNGTRRSEEDVRNSLANSGEWIALAVLDGEVVGFACAQWFQSFCYAEAQGEITEMYIRETARRKGLATLLISFLEEQFRKHGVEEVKIVTGRHNEAAIRMYERSGYTMKNSAVFQKELS